MRVYRRRAVDAQLLGENNGLVIWAFCLGWFHSGGFQPGLEALVGVWWRGGLDLQAAGMAVGR